MRSFHAASPAKHLFRRAPRSLRAVHFAVATELDRGVAFILAPVFLAVGALIYFSLGHEPGFLPLAAGAGGLGVVAS